MKIFDCCPYFDEDMMLDIRFNILDRYVDKFVITEQLYTHSGEKKKQNFDLDNFKRFKDKIIYFLIEKEPDDLFTIQKSNINHQGLKRLNSLKRIQLQYNKLYDGLSDALDNDLVLVSDCDEIPNLKGLNFNRIKNNILLFKQKIFYYKFNLQHKSIDWYGTKGCRKKNLINMEWLKYIKNKKYPFWRLDTLFSKKKYIDVNIVEDGGWHFTNIKHYKDIYYKLMNYGEHNEFELSNISQEDIKRLIEKNQLYFNHSADKSEANKYNSKIKLVKVSNDVLPDFIKDNYDKYEEWFEN